MVVEMEVEKWKLFIQEARNNGGQEGLETCGKRREEVEKGCKLQGEKRNSKKENGKKV